MAEDRILLKADGARFEGWEEVSADRTLDQTCGGFQIGFSERWPGHPDEWRIPAGAPCEVLINDEPILTGYTDMAEYAIGDSDHPLMVSGRDKTQDLVDCSAVRQPSSWKGRRIDQIAADLAEPFGITVHAIGPAGDPFAFFALEQGETAATAIERMARQRALLAISNAKGELELIRPGQVRGGYELVLGENLKSIRFRNDVKDRFSDYLVKAHPGFGGGSDFRRGSEEAPVKGPAGSARDPGVPRYRPLVIMMDETGPAAGMSDRALWEATTRAGKAQEATAVVTGWTAPDGSAYRIDRKVDVHARAAGVDDELLVKAVRFGVSDRLGKVTELTLTRKEAYSLQALPEKGAAAGGKSGGKSGSGSKSKGAGVDPIIGLS